MWKLRASVLCEILFAFSPVPHVTYAEKIMAVKIRIQTQIRPLPFNAEWQLTLLFSGSARTKLSSASKWILLARAKTLNSSEAWGRLAHPQALKPRMFPFPHTESNWNKPNVSSAVRVCQNHSQTRGRILIHAMKSCSTWVNFSASCCF